MAVSDNFNRADADDLGANWTDLVGGMRIVSNTARSENGGVYNWSIWTANTWNNDHDSQVTVQTTPDGGPIVRAGDAAGGGDGYMGMANQSSNLRRIYRRDNGSFTLLSSNDGTVSPGDTIRLEASGSTLNYYQNGGGVLVTASDGTYGSGAAGIYNVGETSVQGVDDWIGTGEVAGGGGAVIPALDQGVLIGGLSTLCGGLA